MAQRKPSDTTDLETLPSDDVPNVQLRVPAHGNGLLQVGNPGNRSGGGVSPSVVRERCRGSFYDRVNTLEKLSDGKPITCPNCRHEIPNVWSKIAPRDRIKAIEVLGRYGLMTGRLDVQEVQQRLQRTIAKVEEVCDPETATRLLAALSPIWDPHK